MRAKTTREMILDELNLVADEYWECLRSDLEHGIKPINEIAAAEFNLKYPKLSSFGGWLSDLIAQFEDKEDD